MGGLPKSFLTCGGVGVCSSEQALADYATLIDAVKGELHAEVGHHTKKNENRRKVSWMLSVWREVLCNLCARILK